MGHTVSQSQNMMAWKLGSFGKGIHRWPVDSKDLRYGALVFSFFFVKLLIRRWFDTFYLPCAVITIIIITTTIIIINIIIIIFIIFIFIPFAWAIVPYVVSYKRAYLTVDWRRIYAPGKWVIIVSGNGLAPNICRAITRTNDDFLETETSGSNFREGWIKTRDILLLNKVYLKLSSAKHRQFCSDSTE